MRRKELVKVSEMRVGGIGKVKEMSREQLVEVRGNKGYEERGSCESEGK